MPQLVGPASSLLTLSLIKGGSLAEDMVTLSVVPLLLFEEYEVSLEVPESLSGMKVGLFTLCPVEVLSMVFLGHPWFYC